MSIIDDDFDLIPDENGSPQWQFNRLVYLHGFQCQNPEYGGGFFHRPEVEGLVLPGTTIAMGDETAELIFTIAHVNGIDLPIMMKTTMRLAQLQPVYETL